MFFEEVEGGTQVTLDVHVTMMTREAPQYLKGMTIGWTQTLDRIPESSLSKHLLTNPITKGES